MIAPVMTLLALFFTIGVLCGFGAGVIVATAVLSFEYHRNNPKSKSKVKSVYDYE